MIRAVLVVPRLTGGGRAAVFFAAALCAFPLLLGPVTPAAARVLEVRPDGGGGRLLERALREAAPGDVVRLGRGVYHGPLVLVRRVRLVGEPGAVIRGDGKGDVIVVTAAGASVEGLTVEGSGRRLETDAAGIRVRADGVRVEANVLRENLHGIYVEQARYFVIRGNSITGLAAAGMEDRGDGIHIFDAHRGIVEGNAVRRARDGIYLDYATGNVVRGNVIREHRIALHVMNSGANTIAGNRAGPGLVGAGVMLSHGIAVRDNVFVGDGDPRGYGLLLKDADDSTVRDNILAGWQRGFGLDGANRSGITGNLLTRNRVGLYLAGNSGDSRIAGNAFVGNTQDVWLERGGPDVVMPGNYWDRAAARGPRWGQGGAPPHRALSVTAYIAGSYPAGALLAVSPAVWLLERLERVLRLPAAVDPAPAAGPPDWLGRALVLERAEAAQAGRCGADPGWSKGGVGGGLGHVHPR